MAPPITPPTFNPPAIPLSFPRQEWWDSEWWKLDTKIGRAANAAKKSSLLWMDVISANHRDTEGFPPYKFKLAVYDRVDQLNHERRRQRPYTGLHPTVESWREETDGLIRMAFDEATHAYPPESPTQMPSFEETYALVRVLLDHRYVQGKDAEPAYTSESDWDEDEYVEAMQCWEPEHSEVDTFYRVWPFDAETAGKEEDSVCSKYYQDMLFLHPLRSEVPEEWRPWKYKVDNDKRDSAPIWYRDYKTGRYFGHEDLSRAEFSKPPPGE